MTEHSFTKIARLRTRLADDVYDQLFAGIISGRIGPGDRLIQETIAEQIDVSRTPVREALLRLEREGVIQPADRRGFVVREITEKEIRDSYQAREAIEGFAGKVVGDMHSEAALARLTETLDTTAEQRQDSMESAYRANETIHRAIVVASGNGFLVELFDAVWNRQVAMRIYADLFNEMDLASNFYEDHASLLQALRRGDGDRACEAIVAHIQDGLRLQIRAMSTRIARSKDTHRPEEVTDAQD